MPPGRGSAAGWKFLAPPYYSQRAVFASPLRVFILLMHWHNDSHGCCCCWSVDSTPFVQPILNYPSSSNPQELWQLAFKTIGLDLKNAVLEHIPDSHVKNEQSIFIPKVHNIPEFWPSSSSIVLEKLAHYEYKSCNQDIYTESGVWYSIVGFNVPLDTV